MCTVCYHPTRLDIARDLLTCPSVAAVAACRHVPREDARKHKARLQSRFEPAPRRMEQLRLADSLAGLNLLLEKTLQVLAAAEENGDLKLMLQAVKEAGRLTNMLHDLSLDQEAASLFCKAGNPNGAPSGFTPPLRRRPGKRCSRLFRAPCPLLAPAANSRANSPRKTPLPFFVRPGPPGSPGPPLSLLHQPWSPFPNGRFSSRPDQQAGSGPNLTG